MGYSPWGRRESDTTEQLTLSYVHNSQLGWGLTPISPDVLVL